MIDPESGMPATSSCPKVRREVYIAGTEPVGVCPLHRGRTVTNVSGWDTTSISPAPALAAPAGAGPLVSDSDGAAPPSTPRRSAVRPVRHAAQAQPQPPEPPKTEKKPGILRRLLDVFK
jgi:hypothetical protein